MNSQELQRTAYTVECFLNALRLEDGQARTEIEEALVRWLADDRRKKNDYLIYQDGVISCYSVNRVSGTFVVPLARQKQTIWCNAARLSAIDGAAFSRNAQLVMLGTAGLLLGMPGVVAAANTPQRQRSSNNNNNNNNNNNG